MKVVVDANIAAAAIVQPDGWTARQLERTDVEWLAPSYLLQELDEHSADYATKAQISQPKLRQRINSFQENVAAVPDEDLLDAANHPIVQQAEAIDPDDAPYLAAVAAADADLLWTRDHALLEAFEGLAVQVVPAPG